MSQEISYPEIWSLGNLVSGIFVPGNFVSKCFFSSNYNDTLHGHLIFLKITMIYDIGVAPQLRLC